MKNQKSVKRIRHWWLVPLNFLVHGIIGLSISLAIGAPAVVLGRVIEKLEEWHVSHFTILVLTYVEKTILLIDATAVICYVAVSTYREIRGLLGTDGEEGA